jgi:hypothetical protein
VSTVKLKRFYRQDATLLLADASSKEREEAEKDAEKEACSALLSSAAALCVSLGVPTNGAESHICCDSSIFSDLSVLLLHILIGVSCQT